MTLSATLQVRKQRPGLTKSLIQGPGTVVLRFSFGDLRASASPASVTMSRLSVDNVLLLFLLSLSREA